MKDWLYPGAQIVALKAEWENVDTGSPEYGPQEDEICVVYCVEEVNGVIYVGLDGYDDVGFEAEAFRPLTKRKTDISIFTALLNTKPANAPADRERTDA